MEKGGSHSNGNAVGDHAVGYHAVGDHDVAYPGQHNTNYNALLDSHAGHSQARLEEINGFAKLSSYHKEQGEKFSKRALQSEELRERAYENKQLFVEMASRFRKKGEVAQANQATDIAKQHMREGWGHDKQRAVFQTESDDHKKTAIEYQMAHAATLKKHEYLGLKHIFNQKRAQG